jgi:GAF domain-containing protein
VTTVVLLSLAALAIALGLCLRLLHRSGEVRVTLLAALLAALAGAGGALLYALPPRPLGFDAATAAALAGLAACIAAPFLVRALATTLEELELAEALHWGSMEGVRALTGLVAAREGEASERLAALLALGCERFGLEVGLVSRIRGARYEIHALHAPQGFAWAPGALLSLEATPCRHTAGSERPLALERVSQAAWARPANAQDLGLEAYLGAPLRAGGELFGTLVFGSPDAREPRFTASQKDLLALMAQWVGLELERDAPGEAAAQRAPSVGAAAFEAFAREPRTARRRARGIDVDAVLGRVERRIRDLVGPGVRLDVHAGAAGTLARDPGVPLESVLLTLVGHAVEAMPAGGTLTLAAASLAARGAAGAGFVTLAVSHTGRGPDAEALSRTFDPARGRAPGGLHGLASLVRALRRTGGDLSVAVEPGPRTTFTLFLPAAAPRTSAAQAALPRAAAAAPPGH